jgi:hypothetical protein
MCGIIIIIIIIIIVKKKRRIAIHHPTAVGLLAEQKLMKLDRNNIHS